MSYEPIAGEGGGRPFSFSHCISTHWQRLFGGALLSTFSAHFITSSSARPGLLLVQILDEFSASQLF